MKCRTAYEQDLTQKVLSPLEQWEMRSVPSGGRWHLALSADLFLPSCCPVVLLFFYYFSKGSDFV